MDTVMAILVLGLILAVMGGVLFALARLLG
jgi:hypothetical protein